MSNIKRIYTLIILTLFSNFISAQNETDSSETLSISDSIALSEFFSYISQVDSIEKTLRYDSVGTISIVNDKANLTIPKNFYYLDAKDARTVLENAWGNPPSLETKGMLITKGGLMSDSLIAITFELTEEGHINDEDAESIDYDELMNEMKKSTIQQNKERVSRGYERVTIVGWASQPYYDKVEKKLHWAKEAKFGDDETNTLNYDIRVLGRESTIDLTFIAGIEQLEDVKSNIDEILENINFKEGYRYADYNPDTDRTAEYGIAGLVAGGLLLKVAKLGFLAKFWKLILIGGAALVVGVKKFLGISKN